MLKNKGTIKESRKSHRLAGESAPNIVGDGGCRKARSRKDPQGQRGVQEPVGTGGGGEELMTIRAQSAQIRSEDPILPRHKTDLKEPEVITIQNEVVEPCPEVEPNKELPKDDPVRILTSVLLTSPCRTKGPTKTGLYYSMRILFYDDC